MVVRRRLATLFGLTLLLGIPSLLVFLEILPKDGFGHPFYWVYDHIYLTLKGYTFHRFFPASLIWWGIALILFLFWLVFYLVDESMLLSPHRDLMRFVVRRSGFHDRLTNSAAWFRKRGFPPLLLIEATDKERAQLLTRLDMGQTDASEQDRLALLTLLQLRLLTQPGAHISDYFRAAVIWQESFLCLRQGSKKRPGATDLAEIPASIARHLMVSPSAQRWRVALEENLGELDGGSLMLDLLLVAALFHAETAEQLLGERASLPPSELRRIVGKYLLDAVEARRHHLDKLRHQLETTAFGARGYVLEPPCQAIPNEVLPFLGQLALGSALDLAVLRAEPSHALAFLESMETLGLAHQLFDAETEETCAEALVRFRALTEGLPRCRDYHRCARLAEEKQARRHQEWVNSAIHRDDLITPEDHALAEARVRTLRLAAGPAFALKEGQ